IPVAIAAITLGPVGGAVTGSVFGLTSFLQCIGIGGTSAMGAILFNINPILAFIQRFVPRFLDGLLLGYIFRGVRKVANTSAACFVTGFCSAFLNTLFFMSALVLLFGNTEYMQGLIGGKNIIVFVCGFVGVNAICEMISATVLTGAIGIALYKAHFVPAPRHQSAKAQV
ncbi:MAG: ECF transporter S component, partial [Lachnospiraceae bacterium]|nr:ECF transporter S component [Lachnospiraceae bacterium]